MFKKGNAGETTRTGHYLEEDPTLTRKQIGNFGLD
jgi:hypothetical protein